MEKKRDEQWVKIHRADAGILLEAAKRGSCNYQVTDRLEEALRDANLRHERDEAWTRGRADVDERRKLGKQWSDAAQAVRLRATAAPGRVSRYSSVDVSPHDERDHHEPRVLVEWENGCVTRAEVKNLEAVS